MNNCIKRRNRKRKRGVVKEKERGRERFEGERTEIDRKRAREGEKWRIQKENLRGIFIVFDHAMYIEADEFRQRQNMRSS